MIDPHDRGTLSDDTSADAERRQVDAWRELSSAEKAQLITALSQAVDRIALAGIRARHPQASDRECFLRLAVLKLGADLASQVYPEAAALSDLR